MMGRAHALSGIAAWGAAAPVVASTTGWFSLSMSTWAVGAVLCAGAALAPDLDHPGRSSASNAIKPVTTMLSTLVAAVAFGHRKGTHSFLAIAVATLGMLLLTSAFSPVGPLIVAFFLAAFTLKALQVASVLPKAVRPFGIAAGAAAITAATAYASGGNYSFLMFAVGFGVFIHIVGDFITIGGVPWFWPLSQRNFRASAISAGGPTERYILTPIFIVAIAAIAFTGVNSGALFGHPIDTDGVRVVEQSKTKNGLTASG